MKKNIVILLALLVAGITWVPITSFAVDIGEISNEQLNLVARAVQARLEKMKEEKSATTIQSQETKQPEAERSVAQIPPEMKAEPLMVEKRLPSLKDEDSKKNESSDYEFNVWGGGWKNLDAGSYGIWGQGEAYKKFDSPRNQPESFGLGGIAKFDYGELDQYDWGYFSIGPAASYWRELSLTDSMQMKLRLPYRWDFNDRENGFMPGIYAEYARILGMKDTGILSAETWIFPDDSYLGFQAIWEHWMNQDWKTRAGGTAFWNFLGDGTHFGWGPTIGVKFRNRLTVGANIAFLSGGATSVGTIVGYDYNSYLAEIMEKDRQQRLEKKEEGKGESAEIGQVALTDSENGYYNTLPVGSGVSISEDTLAEEIKKKKETEQ